MAVSVACLPFTLTVRVVRSTNKIARAKHLHLRGIAPPQTAGKPATAPAIHSVLNTALVIKSFAPPSSAAIFFGFVYAFRHHNA